MGIKAPCPPHPTPLRVPMILAGNEAVQVDVAMSAKLCDMGVSENRGT